MANAVLPAGEVVNHARRVAERFNALPPGAVRETKQLMRRAAARSGAADDRVEGGVFAQAPAQPRGEGGVPGLLPEAQARLLEVLSALEPDELRRAHLALALASWCCRRCWWRRRCARARARRCCPRPPAARRRRRRGERRALRLLIAGDSSAAGVGVAHQDQALAGHLVRALQRIAARPVHWTAARASGLTTRAGACAAARARCSADRSRGGGDRRQRRHRPGSARVAPCAHREAMADWLLDARLARARDVRAAAADAPVSAAAAAAAPRDRAPMRGATTRRWRAGRRRAATCRACRSTSS